MRLRPLVRRPTTKSGPALSPTIATNPARPTDSNTHSVGDGMRPKTRGHIERSQPQTSPPSSTPTLRLKPISIRPDNQRGNANQRPRDDAERHEHHVGRLGGAIGDANVAHRILEAARRSHQRDDVAAMNGGSWKNRHTCTARVRRRRYTLRAASSFASSPSVRRSIVIRHDDVQFFCRDVEQRLVIDFAQSQRLLVEPRHQQLAPPVMASVSPPSTSRRLVGIEGS